MVEELPELEPGLVVGLVSELEPELPLSEELGLAPSELEPVAELGHLKLSHSPRESLLSASESICVNREFASGMACASSCEI
ncbi:MAG TPA: hypothetical protein VFX09_00055 [Burkholderiales bacterium]|nr:hypothetical protein [Burkholderiales bacterium]